MCNTPNWNDYSKYFIHAINLHRVNFFAGSNEVWCNYFLGKLQTLSNLFLKGRRYTILQFFQGVDLRTGTMCVDKNRSTFLISK